MDFIKTLSMITKKFTRPEQFTDIPEEDYVGLKIRAVVNIIISCLYAYFFYIYIYTIHPTLSVDMKYRQMLNILAWFSYISNIANAILNLLALLFI
jgi:hypothetical protein